MRRCLVCAAMLCLVIMLGCSENDRKNSQENDMPKGNEGQTASREEITGLKNEKVDIVLYFSRGQTGKLTAEKRRVDRAAVLENAEKTIINELIKGPSEKTDRATIPEGTKVLSVQRDSRTVTLNLSKEFENNHPGGSAAEMLTIYSIVNSLTELKEVERVHFLIEGEKKSQFKGHYRFDAPFERNISLVEADKNN